VAVVSSVVPGGLRYRFPENMAGARQGASCELGHNNAEAVVLN
jgi:hypothetical protein